MGGLGVVVLVLLHLWGVISLYQYVTYFFKNPPALLMLLGFLPVVFGYSAGLFLIPFGFQLQIVWVIVRHLQRR